jgi:hypothetical protein
LPILKLVCIDIQPYGSTQAPERADVLNIGGFRDAMFQVVASSVWGRFLLIYRNASADPSRSRSSLPQDEQAVEAAPSDQRLYSISLRAFDRAKWSGRLSKAEVLCPRPGRSESGRVTCKA